MSGLLKAIGAVAAMAVTIRALDWASGLHTEYAGYVFSIAFYALWRTYSIPAAVVQPQHPSHDGQAQSASPNGDDARKSQQSKER